MMESFGEYFSIVLVWNLLLIYVSIQQFHGCIHTEAKVTNHIWKSILLLPKCT